MTYRKGDHVRWYERFSVQWVWGTVVEDVTDALDPVVLVWGRHSCPAKYRHHPRFMLDHGRVTPQ